MLKVSIVVDTNIMISDLEIVKKLYNANLPFLFTVNFCREVLEELESKKTHIPEARMAIRFIERNSKSMITEIEGRIDDRKIEVVVDCKAKINERNNDDKILNYCFSLENPILLTNDKAFSLKCHSHNIKVIIVENKSIETIVKDILSELGLTDLELSESAIILLEKTKYLLRMKAGLLDTLLPTILSISQRELGNELDDVAKSKRTLEFYLDFVCINFNYFTKFLPKKSPIIIQSFLKHLKNENVPKLKELIHPLCMIFRTSAPSSSL